MRFTCALLVAVLAVACSNDTEPPVPAGSTADTPARDAQHQGVTGPHGDHTPKHGGMVLMNGDVHYEVVLAKDGRHQIWFTDAMRNELPASIAAGVTMEVTRPNAPAETVSLAIDDAGEAWIASGRPLGGGEMVKVRYTLQGEPLEVQLPYVSQQN